MLNPYYVTGFTEAGGSFYVSVSPRKLEHVQWEIRPTFSLSQKKENRGILYQIKDFFGCGSVRPSRKDDTYKYEVRNLEEINKRVLPHFKNYPLLSTGKRKDFEVLCKVVEMMLQKKHLEKEGLKEILQIIFKASSDSKRIYNQQKLNELMNV